MRNCSLLTDITNLRRQALHLACFTIAYNVVECVLALVAGARLSVALLIGLGLNYWFGIWQADPVIGLVIVALLIREGYHTFKAEKLCSYASCGCPPPSPEA